ncbi:hypothetical protein EDB92DRAFT_132661 [Lactarius akahatsu]|uniref:Uncharacterized protein n=1 Tax=Lactarius akahatsu TaxID=416441 RepID=A0AAD4L865_9AGAM|nr:hypothetical protein EDB92DRAFT_132661 [Lactarius akahatsu]
MRRAMRDGTLPSMGRKSQMSRTTNYSSGPGCRPMIVTMVSDVPKSGVYVSLLRHLNRVAAHNSIGPVDSTMTQASRVILPSDVNGPWDQRIDMTVNGSIASARTRQNKRLRWTARVTVSWRSTGTMARAPHGILRPLSQPSSSVECRLRSRFQLVSLHSSGMPHRRVILLFSSAVVDLFPDPQNPLRRALFVQPVPVKPDLFCSYQRLSPFRLLFYHGTTVG